MEIRQSTPLAAMPVECQSCLSTGERTHAEGTTGTRTEAWPERVLAIVPPRKVAVKSRLRCKGPGLSYRLLTNKAIHLATRRASLGESAFTLAACMPRSCGIHMIKQRSNTSRSRRRCREYNQQPHQKLPIAEAGLCPRYRIKIGRRRTRQKGPDSEWRRLQRLNSASQGNG